MQTRTQEKLTYADLAGFPDDGRRHELIGGAHYVTPSPATGHQRLVVRLVAAFSDYFRAHPVGEVFAAPFDVLLSEHDVVEPDLLVILQDQDDILTEQHVRGAPAIVIEILSPATRRRDEGIKRRLYERTGVREYWVFDEAGAVVKAFRRGAGQGFEPAVVLAAEARAVLTSPLLPELAIDVSALFKRRLGR
jgi:Uma2 family endonuclease